MTTERKIIHIDMDAFYASVEQRDHPEFRGRPLVVGSPEKRGVISAASYEARRYGIRSAMPSATARRLCPDLIFVPLHMETYRNVSREIHRIFHDYTDRIEPIALDEAFLDVTENKKNIPLAVDIAREIKYRIRKELDLIASAGVSYNKFLAKIASDFRKPDGLCTIHPSRAATFIARLPIESFWGVGRVTARRMHELGIHNGADLRACSLAYLTERFGKTGKLYYDFAHGIDPRPVESVRIRKSVGCETTFEQDLSDTEVLSEALHRLTALLNRRLEQAGFSGHTLTLKIKFADFQRQSRSITPDYELNPSSDIFPLARHLLLESDAVVRPVRLLGLAVSNPSRSIPHELFRQLSLDL